ncbi:uncharacterized protein LOC117314792 [Pecten maximus]|uniref:uncharacterized protein LOC117314792 n=1 Tax=Pecten maximus TaxID=6579 RepID=UPI0014584AE5|nr:uncharacterized protein LOC117314792 [Pecten maximus]
MSDGYKFDLLSTMVTCSSLYFIVKGEIVNTPKQYVNWNAMSYTLLSSVGYNQAISPFTFEVKTCSDAHIGLMEFDHQFDQGRIYEIVIGGWGNTQSVLRSEKQGSAQNTHVERNIISCTEFRTFQITWDNSGSVKVFKYQTGQMDKILVWSDPNPFSVNYISVSTGPAGDGVWNITIPVEITTTTTTITTNMSSAPTTTNISSAPSSTTSTLPATPYTTSGTSESETDILSTSITATQETRPTTACPCSCGKPHANYTQEQLNAEIQKLRTEMLVVKSTTSKYIRSKRSASDSRTSSKVMGFVAGLVLVCVFGGLILLDFHQFDYDVQGMPPISFKRLKSTSYQIKTLSPIWSLSAD